jgi:hypothetical protein
MDRPLRVEPRKIKFTTYGPARAPVWAVTFALHASRGYEHRCTVVVPGLGDDDVTDVCAKARVELSRIASLLPPGPAEQARESEPPSPQAPAVLARSRGPVKRT